VEQLLQAGFDASTARLLADQYPAPVIAHQIEWLPLRQARCSRLGLLRRAIEGDWPKPEPATPVLSEDERLGAQFARYYYAGYHGNEGDPAVDPCASDIPAAARFVQQLLALEPEASLVPQWGRRLGRLVRAKHQGDAKAKPFLTSALTLYGEELVRGFHQARTRRRAERQRQARAEHHHACRPAYEEYLRATEQTYQEQYPARYAEFLRQRQQARDFARHTLRSESSTLLSSLDGEASRLHAFAECFRQDPYHPVLTFWQWDRQYNPQPFRFTDDAPPGTPP
jgi:hypothetical protein